MKIKVHLLIMLCLVASLSYAREYTLVKDGKACFRVVTSREKLDRVSEVGPTDLANFTKEATGAKVKIVPGSKLADEKEDLINIFVGIASYGSRYSYEYPKPAGYRIICPDDRNIIIAGLPYGEAEFNSNDGVFHFLEKYLGIRFLMPGEVGTYVSKIGALWKVDIEEERRVPDIFSRQISGVHGQAYGNRERYEQNAAFLFAMRSSMSASVSLKFNHNVGNLIDPEVYGEAHPEFFPLIDGKRRIPPKLELRDWRLRNWEPCYTAPGIAEEAAKNVIKFFDENPTLYSCSLAVNDSGNICQCENCRRVNKDLPKESESQSYYEWVCKVVDIVKKKYPDRKFGLLNYWATKDMPSNVKMDENVIPMVCEDLNYYVDPALYDRLEKRLLEWDKVASSIGWWDYSFEGDYMFPSYNPHYTARMLRHLYHDHNLRAYMDELHPSRYCRNAPELYMIMKLLWNVDTDPDALLDEWFNLAVGEKAAPYLKAYFAIWEKVWTYRIPETPWFKNRAKAEIPFLQRKDATYLDALRYDDVKDAMDLLQKCVEFAPEGKEKLRAQFFMDYFAMAADKFFLPYLNCSHLAEELKKRDVKGRVVCSYSFDKGYEPWVPWQQDRHTAVLKFNKEEGHNAPGSLELNIAKSLPTGMVYYKRPLDFELKAGKCYRISVWCKGQGIEKAGDGTASMVLYFPLKGGGVLGRGPNSGGGLSVRTTLADENMLFDGWKKMELYVSVPKTAWDIVAGIDCQLEATVRPANAAILYDDFLVEELDMGDFKPYQEFGKERKPKKDDVYVDAETGERLGPELIIDGDMEAPDLDVWLNCYEPKVKEKSRNVFHSGKQSLHIVSDSPGDGVLQIIRPVALSELFYKPLPKMKVGATYRVQLWVKNVAKDGYNDLRLSTTGLKHPLKTEDGEWHFVRQYVKYVNPISTDFICIGYGSDKSDVYVDDVSVREVLK